MQLVIALSLVTAGVLLLVGGGEALVRGAVAIARKLRISPAVVGLTIVAFATSLPELAVSLMAALRGSPDVAVGNVVGSNIFNLGAILGLSAFLFPPLGFRSQGVRKDTAAMFVASLLAIVWLRGGEVTRAEGVLALTFLLFFLIWRVADARRYGTPDSTSAGGGARGAGATGESISGADVQDATVAGATRSGAVAGDTIAAGARAPGAPPPQTGKPAGGRVPPRFNPTLRSVLEILGGALLLTVGAEVLVRGAVGLAEMAGVSERVIAVTLVSAGTGLPELATAVIAGIRRHAGVAVGNVVGSNIFNLCGILGTVAVAHPLRVAPELANGDAWWMLGFCLVALFPGLHPGRRLSRAEGLVAIAAYGLYLARVL